MIELLEWDTTFFGWKTGRSVNPTSSRLVSEQALNEGYKLLYITSDKPINLHTNEYEGVELLLADVKLNYSMDISTVENLPENNNVSEYKSNIVCEELLELALLSGSFSRFKTDPHFQTKDFERLYTSWITSSVNKKIADYVFVTNEYDRITGMVTLSIREGIAKIGLIAVDTNHQGKQLGKQLIDTCKKTALQHDCRQLEVPTQAANQQACLFYERMGFILQQTTYIYHLWIN